MSVLAEIAALKTADVCLGKLWVRVRLFDTPSTLKAELSLRLAAGVGEKAQQPDRPEPAVTAPAMERLLAAHVPIICDALVAVAKTGPDGQPVEWEDCKVVALEADEDPATGTLSVPTLDKILPGAVLAIAQVAMHKLIAEAGVLRPFSTITPSSSG